MRERPVPRGSNDKIALSPPVRLLRTNRYPEIQGAVDTLSDEGFPVTNVSIVWEGLRQVEQVIGRRTVISSGLDGAIAGAWFGSLIGLLFAVLADDTTGLSVIGTVAVYLLVGAIAGAAWRGVSHWMRNGARDFATAPYLDAEIYELWVAADLEAEAAALLGLEHRPGTTPSFEHDGAGSRR